MPGIRPLRNLVYVEKIRETVSKGGIHLPQTFRAGKNGHSVREKMNAVADVFRAKVLAVGPEVRGLSEGDECMVYTFAEGDGSTLWTGTSDDGKRADKAQRLFVRYPDDIVCAVDKAAAE